jgi:hypothetical protein
MGVLLQGFFKLPPNNALPSPADGKQEVPWWWDHLAAQARDLSLTAVWLPPVLKTASGANQGADGYGVFDDYDIVRDRKRDRCRPDTDRASNCNAAPPFCVPMVSTFTWTWWNTSGSAT